MNIEKGICDICGLEKEETAQESRRGLRICSSCGRLDTINKKNNRRIRSSCEEKKEKTFRINNSKWIS